ncbi:MoxR family ATPase [Frankia sp. CNm7]|uniref:MoxR family ATPase n=2 Tax=Frankia nepalensis TaxID=1836974 RepID=A0A937RDH5_9ACTN|nr:MoxR family ATPase [Frankia nepalensis]MBL7509256.1 MoxR family ATPase [Frankia nepalensis]MBL7517285.1 MoxR family ATPase [Frankia nepalensis]MBL7626980.1 MoxR family ATPase [Frankia nepalensis]
MGLFAQDFRAIAQNIETSIHGKSDVIKKALVCLFAEGHLLIEDVPGVGKTSLARAIARTLDLAFGRIQFTPDLVPADVTGTDFYSQRTEELTFRPGPVFTQLLLADELNRASPRTQSALLEAMQENQVTVNGRTMPLERPFFVIATQNSVEMSGTYALPEAQLDRFLLRVSLGYPEHASEIEILENHRLGRREDEQVSPVVRAPDLLRMVETAAEVHVSWAIHDYIVRLVAATRRHPRLALGASPRASIALLRASRAQAAADGRNYVRPADVQFLAEATLAHRVVRTPEAELSGLAVDEIIKGIVAAEPVPSRLGQQ